MAKRVKPQLCAACNEAITDEYVTYDLPENMTFSQVEFYVYGLSQFCRLCISEIRACDEVEYRY